MSRLSSYSLVILSITFLLGACDSDTSINQEEQSLFSLMPDSLTGIQFINDLMHDEKFNVYTYRNFYNGAGVGLGDFNNDGLLDVYMVGNMVDNKLYLNQGDWKFKDITESAGVACHNVWSTGVSIADVNGDGLQDIYVCKGGKPEGNNRRNELFINNGDLTFTEKAAEWGINDFGLSTHAAFFDYDKDGDLDCYLLNNSIRPIGSFDLRRNQRYDRDPDGNKLYRNDGNKFTDVSEEANIYGSIIGFGLGVTIGDVNRDTWPDIFVSNDFFERDYLYINNQDGTFTESLEPFIKEISAASMGADMADINNDGYPEIFVTDMLPRSDARIKTKTTFENWDKYVANLRAGYYHQFTRNVLQLNNGNNSYSEIGRLAGVHATDWSWGALIMDMDNDGYKDIFVANGIVQDLTDQDYINFYSNPRVVRAIVRDESKSFLDLIKAIPSNPLPNHAFHNQGDLTFDDKADSWGLGTPGFSNGSVYGDLDNDGDLDLVVNNLNMPSFIYRNNTSEIHKDRHYLQFELTGKDKNLFALGAQIVVKHKGEEFFVEQAPMRGFQSTIDHRPHIGLGTLEKVDSVIINWPDNKLTVLTDLATDQVIKLKQEDAQDREGIFSSGTLDSSPQIFTEITSDSTLSFTHKENNFKDFDRDRLIYHMISAEGPAMAKADVNGDGLDDLYMGGAKDSPGSLFIQQSNGSFSNLNQALFEEDKLSEDVDCAFFDADGDGDMDLYVASGGNDLPDSNPGLQDRLYINNGSGQFTRSEQVLPNGRFESTGCVAPADFDKDGDIDLFVGLRLKAFNYGFPVNGYLLENDGSGQFTNVTEKLAPDLTELGMMTDAEWQDMDGDQDLDLIIVGEYMPITVFMNDGTSFTNSTSKAGLELSNGYWNTIKSADLDKDGDIDFILGNHGLNSRFKASEKYPVCMHINDFDRNGSIEQIVCVYEGEKSYPLALRHDLVMQLPKLKKKYLKYEDYKEQTIEDLFTPEERNGMLTKYAHRMESSIAVNNGDGTFSLIPLPTEAQLSPIYAIEVADFDKDGHDDILLGGNLSRSKPEVGVYQGTFGLLLKGKGNLDFEVQNSKKTGFFLEGDTRAFQLFDFQNESWLLAAVNDNRLRIFRVN